LLGIGLLHRWRLRDREAVQQLIRDHSEQQRAMECRLWRLYCATRCWRLDRERQKLGRGLLAMLLPTAACQDHQRLDSRP